MSAVGRRFPIAAPETEVPSSELVDAVTEAARGLRFGSIEVVIHEGRVVQVVRTEKRRLAR